MLRAAIQSQGFDVYEINAITSDEKSALKESILKALAEADMVITSGGVSMGETRVRYEADIHPYSHNASDAR